MIMVKLPVERHVHGTVVGSMEVPTVLNVLDRMEPVRVLRFLHQINLSLVVRLPEATAFLLLIRLVPHSTVLKRLPVCQIMDKLFGRILVVVVRHHILGRRFNVYVDQMQHLASGIIGPDMKIMFGNLARP